MTREELAAELERLPICGSAAGLLFLCRDNLRSILAALRAPTEAQVERAAKALYLDQNDYAPDAPETMLAIGPWPPKEPYATWWRAKGRAALLAAREPRDDDA